MKCPYKYPLLALYGFFVAGGGIKIVTKQDACGIQQLEM